jgi:DNA-binding HxlR family transcriptional regulator
MSRSYAQGCYIARALDVLGERRTLLIVRELILGPRRYGDLLEALPGMGTSLLASRLKQLERYEVVRRTTLPGPGRTAAYELAERGRALTPALAELARWGADLGQAPAGHADRAAWAAVAMRLTAPGEAAGFTTLTQLHVGAETLWLQGDGETVRFEHGPAPLTAALRLTCDKDTFYALGRAELGVDDAVAAGRLTIEGDIEAARAFFELFRLPAGHHAASG